MANLTPVTIRHGHKTNSIVKKTFTNIPSISNRIVYNSLKPNLSLAFIICFTGVMFGGISSMLITAYLPSIAMELGGNITNAEMINVSAYINSVFVFGSILGGFTWIFVCDKIGRFKGVILSTALCGLSTIVTALSTSWVMIGICRFVTGFSVGGVLLTNSVLIAELWPENKKAAALSIVSSAMPLGFITAGTIGNLLSNWHYAFLTGIIPLLTAIASIFILLSCKKLKENQLFFSNNIPLSTKPFAAVDKRNLFKCLIIFGGMLMTVWAVFSWVPIFAESTVSNATKANDLRGLTMMVLATSSLGGSIVTGSTANAIGLRKTMMIYFAVSFIMTFMLFRLQTSLYTATFIEMSILSFFFGISQGALSVYMSSSFPQVVRPSAPGFCLNKGRMFTAAAVFFTGALISLSSGHDKSVFTFSGIFLPGLVFTYFSTNSTKAKAQKSQFNPVFD